MTVFKFHSLEEAHQATGLVVVIDVLRAFTTAAYAFHVGAKRILPVAEVVEALELRKLIPGSMIMGEVDGEKQPEFDYGNSPATISALDLDGKILIQRTSAGTQGIVLAKKAEKIFAASFVVAKATAVTIRHLNPDVVSFIITGESMGRDGDEDLACAEYIQALITDQNVDPMTYTDRVEKSSAGKNLLDIGDQTSVDKDLALSMQPNLFSFSLPVHKIDDKYLMVCNKL